MEKQEQREKSVQAESARNIRAPEEVIRMSPGFSNQEVIRDIGKSVTREYWEEGEISALGSEEMKTVSVDWPFEKFGCEGLE